MRERSWRETAKGIRHNFLNCTDVNTPRGKATVYFAASKPTFIKFNEQGFPVEWSGSLFWELLYDDGAVVRPEDDGRPKEENFSLPKSKRCVFFRLFLKEDK